MSMMNVKIKKKIIKLILLIVVVILILIAGTYYYFINRKLTSFNVFNLDYSYDLSENLRREIQVDNYGNYTIYLVSDGQMDMKKGKLSDKELNTLKKAVQTTKIYDFQDTYDCFEVNPEKCPFDAPTKNLLVTLDDVPKNIHIYHLRTPWLLSRIINLSEKAISNHSN